MKNLVIFSALLFGSSGCSITENLLKEAELVSRGLIDDAITKVEDKTKSIIDITKSEVFSRTDSLIAEKEKDIYKKNAGIVKLVDTNDDGHIDSEEAKRYFSNLGIDSAKAITKESLTKFADSMLAGEGPVGALLKGVSAGKNEAGEWYTDLKEEGLAVLVLSLLYMGRKKLLAYKKLNGNGNGKI